MKDLQQQRDDISTRSIGAVGAGSLAIVAVGVVVCVVVLRDQAIAGAAPARKSPEQIGIVEQSAINDAHRALDLRRAQHAALTRYRFLDDHHKTAEIPIDRAIEIIAEKER